jgi:RNA polymerase sigma-70 factor (sigma-E family)
MIASARTIEHHGGALEGISTLSIVEENTTFGMSCQRRAYSIAAKFPGCRAQPGGGLACLTRVRTVPVDEGVDVVSANVMVEVYRGQYPSLVRLAAMLLDESHAAEDVVQDAYVKVAARHYRLRDPEKAVAYLRQAVVNLARNSLRRRLLARRHAVQNITDVASAEDTAIDGFQRQVVVRALRVLSRRHREVLVLRYYLDCSVEETAELLGLSAGAVKAYTSRGFQQLKALIEKEEEIV